MSDIYDEAVEYFKTNPGEIYDAWNDPYGYDMDTGEDYAMALFGPAPGGAGCLTQIHSGKLWDEKSPTVRAATPELTAAIKADERLSDDGENITPDMLPVFAEWQRKLHAQSQNT